MRRLRPFLLILSSLLPLPASANGLAVVVNSAEASLSLIDMDQRVEVARVPMLREPHHLALTPDRKSLLVGDTAGNTLFYLDPQTGQVQHHIPLSDPYQLEFSPNGKWLTVAGLARNQIDIYDAASMHLVRRIPAASMPSHINYAPDSGVVYVSLQGSDSLIAILPATGEVLWRKTVGRTPAGVLWINGRLLVGIMGSDHVAVVDPADGRVERKIVTGRGAHNLFLAPDGKTLYVCNRVDGSISVVDPVSLTVRRTIRVPGGPDDLDFAPDGKIWVSRRFAHSVAILDLSNDRYETIPVGRSPHGIWLNPLGRAETQRLSLERKG